MNLRGVGCTMPSAPSSSTKCGDALDLLLLDLRWDLGYLLRHRMSYRSQCLYRNHSTMAVNHLLELHIWGLQNDMIHAVGSG